MQFLICFPTREDERGKLPPIPPGAYVGYFDASNRRLIFIYDPASGSARLYLSSFGWDQAFAMSTGRLPNEIVLDSHEAAWAVACWKAVQTQLKTKTF